MQFIADENVPRHVFDRLRADGHDVTTIAGPLSGIPDREVLRAAESEGRILITADRDFGELLVRHRLGVSGVIVFQLERLSNPAKADRVADVVAVHVDRLAGHLTVIEPARTRIRPLPRQPE
jgi:predicted nuclease of predicted toxin-antitoxin system